MDSKLIVGTLKRKKKHKIVPACVTTLFLSGFRQLDRSFPRSFSSVIVVCYRDPHVLGIEPLSPPFLSFGSEDGFILVSAVPYPGPADMISAYPAALGAYSSAGLTAGRSPVFAFFQRRPAYAADVFVYLAAGGLISSNTA